MVKKTKTKIKKYGNAMIIVIPAGLFNDSTFPFKKNEQVDIGIDDGAILVYKEEEI